MDITLNIKRFYKYECVDMINVYNTEHERILSIFTKMEITFIYGNYKL